MTDYKDENFCLMHGDCLERMKEIPDQSVDAIICDPPYGTTACKWDSVIDLGTMWVELERIIKPNGAIVLFAGQPFTSALIMSNPTKFKYCWVWDKVRAVGAHVSKYRPLARHEDIVVFGDGRITYNRQMEKRGKPRKGSKEYGRSSIIGGNINDQWNTEDRVYTEKKIQQPFRFSVMHLTKIENTLHKNHYH